MIPLEGRCDIEIGFDWLCFHGLINRVILPYVLVIAGHTAIFIPAKLALFFQIVL
jgi:hypothetical protein